MTLLSWLLLLLIYFGMLIVGMFLFHHTECPKELEDLEVRVARAQELVAMVRRVQGKVGREVQGEVEHLASRALESPWPVAWNPLAPLNSTAEKVCTKWDKPNSFFFAFTVVTTIGERLPSLPSMQAMVSPR